MKDTQTCLVSFLMLVLKRLPVCLILGKELGEGTERVERGGPPSSPGQVSLLYWVQRREQMKCGEAETLGITAVRQLGSQAGDCQNRTQGTAARLPWQSVSGEQTTQIAATSPPSY